MWQQPDLNQAKLGSQDQSIQAREKGRSIYRKDIKLFNVREQLSSRQLVNPPGGRHVSAAVRQLQPISSIWPAIS